MKKLFSCLITLLCITALTLPAMADVLPPNPIELFLKNDLLFALLLAVVAIVVVIIILIIRKRKK